jgi:hypothetical protein
MYKTPAYVGIILKKDNQVLLIKRTNTDWASGYWNFFGGLLEENEILIAAAARHSEIEWFDTNNLPENITENALQALYGLQNKVSYSVK